MNARLGSTLYLTFFNSEKVAWLYFLYLTFWDVFLTVSSLLQEKDSVIYFACNATY